MNFILSPLEPNSKLFLSINFLIFILFAIIFLLVSFWQYRNDNVKKFFYSCLEQFIPFIGIFKNYFLLFKEEFLLVLSAVGKFIKAFHTVFSFLLICILFQWGMNRTILVIIIYEVKQQLLKRKFFVDLFDRLENDTLVIKNHWNQDFDLIWLNRIIILIRILGLLIAFLGSVNALFEPITPYLSSVVNLHSNVIVIFEKIFLDYQLGFSLLILSFVFEYVLNVQIICYRNTPVDKPWVALGTVTYKLLTQTLPTIGSEFVVNARLYAGQMSEALYANRHSIRTGGSLLALYELSKHPSAQKILDSELDSATGSHAKQLVQETIYGVKITKPHEKDQLIILTALFPDLKPKEFAEMFAVNGHISEQKIRTKYEEDPSFASKFELYHLQTFGLGDKIDPESARESNRINIARSGRKICEQRGLLIDESSFSGNTKISPVVTKIYGIPTAALKAANPLTMKDLPGFDPKDPAANLPKVTESKDWFKVSPPK